MGAAISKHLRKLDVQQFGKMLDVYDEDHLGLLPSIPVPEPEEMVNQLIMAQNKTTSMYVVCLEMIR